MRDVPQTQQHPQREPGRVTVEDGKHPAWGHPTRRVIGVSCSVHGGSRGFTNLVVTKRENLIELDPHAMGSCVIIFDEKAASALFDVLGEWLG